MKIGQVKRATVVPERSRGGGAGRPRSEFISAVLELTEAENQLPIEFEPDDTYENSEAGFRKWAASLSTRITTARNTGVLNFETQLIPTWDSARRVGTVDVYRTSGELAQASAARREKMRATRKANAAKR